MIDRRKLLGTMGACCAFTAGGPTLAFASGPTDKKLVVIVLRGGMDGLYAVPAYGDPDYYSARNGIGIARPGQAKGALDLDGFFGVHPVMADMQKRFAQKELIVFHAIAPPYRDRSHFDGQNLLENGTDKPYGLPDGWLNRALAGLPDNLKSGRADTGIALASAMPLLMRGPNEVTSWSPSVLPSPNSDMLNRLEALYKAKDPKLADALTGAINANATSGESRAGGGDEFVVLMAAAGKFLSTPNGPCVAMLESTGWDTHAAEAGPYGALERNLSSLNHGLEALANGMGSKWSDTAVLMMTEFGRMVAANGTGGTDHGTGGASFLMGGAVKGGRVIADWPGLKPANLYQGRDLMTTSDTRSVAKALLHQHMGIDEAYIEKVVFPDSAAAKPMDGLLRA